MCIIITRLLHGSVTLNHISDVLEDMSKIGITLTAEQDKAVRALLSGQDVLAVLPTGAGKSLIFQSIAHSLAARCLTKVVIVVTPLNSISFLHIKTMEKVKIYVPNY
jgi:superfamily II DNA helicase RecQ